MQTVNIHEAKTYLSRLVEAAVKGEPFIIAKAGKPLVKVVAVEAPAAPKRLGFMRGAFTIPMISTRWIMRRLKSCSTATNEAPARHPHFALGRSRAGEAFPHGQRSH